MNKNILTIIVLVVIVAAGIWYWKSTYNVAVPTIGSNTGDEKEILTYADPQGVFSFKYPSDFIVTGRELNTFATVKIPRGYFPQTNFSEATLTISSTGPSTDSDCKGTTNSREPAAGNIYDTTTTKKIYDGDCYVFEYIIHSTNIGNYDPSQEIKAFDEDQVKEDLDEIVDSFEYLVNSD